MVAELTEGLLEGAIDAPTATPEAAVEEAPVEEEKAEDDLQEMKARLESL